MQNVHPLSHPTAIETHARKASSRAAGRADGNSSVYSATSICGPLASARRRSSRRCGRACVPITTSTHGARCWIRPWSVCARQPATTTRRSGSLAFKGLRWPRLPYSLRSAFSRIAHVFRTTTRASRTSSVGVIPSSRSMPPIRSESCSFIWHPKVRIRKLPSISLEATRAPRPASDGLAGELGRPRLPDHGDLDLARVLELLLDLLRDVARDRLRLEIVHVLRRDHHPHLAARLHREHLLDALVLGADLLQTLEALDVGLQRLTPRTGPAAADRIGDLREDRVHGSLLHLPVVRLDAVDDVGVFLPAPSDLGADDRVRPLDLVRDGLADVVQERSPLRDRRVDPDLRGESAGDVGRLHEVLQHVLSVARAVLEPAEEPDQLRVHVGEAHLGDRVLSRLPDLLLEVPQRALVDLLDPSGLDPAVLHQLLEGHPGGLATDGVEAGQDDGLRRVVDDDVDARGGLERADVASLAADDPALHVLARQREHADAGLGRLLRGHALDRDRHDLPRSLLPLLASSLLDLANLRH